MPFIEVTALLATTGAPDPESTEEILINVDAVDLVEPHEVPGMYNLVFRGRDSVLTCKGTVEDFRMAATSIGVK